MPIWRRRRAGADGPDGVAIRVRPPRSAGLPAAADLRPGRDDRASGRAIPRPLALGVLLATGLYVIAHLSVVTGVWPVHGTAAGAGATLMRDAVALVAWLLVLPALRLLGYRGNWAVVALPIIIFLLIRPSLFQLFTDPVYQATRETRVEANALKAERAQLTTLLRAYDEPRRELVFGDERPALPDPWQAASLAVRDEAAPLARWMSYLAVFLAPVAVVLGFVAARQRRWLRALREHKRWPFLVTLAAFFVLTLFFTELGKVGGTTPWELLMPVFVLTWGAVLADDTYNLARPGAVVAPRRVLGLLVYGALPIVPFLTIRELGLSVVFAGTLAVMLLVGTRRGWWAGLMVAVWSMLVIAAFNLDDRSATRLALAYDPYSDIVEMTEAEATRWAASVHQIKLFDANVLAGGLLGQGPGRGHAETAPNAADDGFITTVAAQYGLLGTLAFVAIYTLFLLQMIAVAIRERGAFERTVVIGLALLIAIPFWLAVLGGMRVIPLTGVAAAFAAHGGAKLLAASASVGVIAAISHLRETDRALEAATAPGGQPEHGVRIV